MEPEDDEAFVSLLEQLADGSANVAEKRERAYRAAHTLYSMPVIAGMWNDLIQKIRN
jgi:glycosyltransferase involved in cell wall biosynthesis